MAAAIVVAHPASSKSESESAVIDPQKVVGSSRSMRQDTVYETNGEQNMVDTKKVSEETDQNRSDETAIDRDAERIADKAAKKAIESEKRFDEEHGIFTK